ncbi:MAG: MFS transporter [Chloroflexi bacterium]|nr:MFS transporter [Chloroflexota bacterium]
MQRRLLTVYSEYPKPFWVLMLGTFIDRLGGYLLFPFFSLYITQRFDVGLTQVGILFAIFSVTGALGGILGGALTDKLGRRSMLIFGLLISGASSLLMGIIDNLNLFYAFAGIVGLVSNAGGPAQQAMIADLLPDSKRTEGYGMHRVVFNVSAAIGPALGGLLAGILGYMALFIADAVTSAITAAIVFIAIPETKPQLAEGQKEETLVQSVGGYGTVFRDRAYMFFLFVSTLATIVYVQMNSTMPVFLRDQHGIDATGYGLILALNATMVVLLQFWFTRRIKGRPAMLMMTLGTLLYAIGFGMYGFGSTLLYFMFAMVVITIGEMIVAPVGTTLVARFAPEQMRGRYMAIFGFTWGIAFAVGPLLAGYINDYIAPNWVWYGAFVVGMFSTMGYFTMHYSDRKRTAEPVESPSAS